jgi:2,4-dienoyl-CoA reductase (NADPH2)
MPRQAEIILARGDADMISMARPFLADAAWVHKAREGREDEINTCIACNQACLDRIFVKKVATCLVNPRACYETRLNRLPANTPKRIAVVGSGPAGLAFATWAARRGHHITLFEKASEIGGQLNLAKIIPGKEEFHETLRYFRRQIELNQVRLILNKTITASDLITEAYEAIVLATGIWPRKPEIEGIDHPKVLSYLDVLNKMHPVGRRAAIIGAGGIGFDVAAYLTHTVKTDPNDIKPFLKEWGIDSNLNVPGGLVKTTLDESPPKRFIHLLQRSNHKVGAGLGKTTGWIHRRILRRRGVKMLNGVAYQKIDDQGLHIMHRNQARVLEVDHIVTCAGQISRQELKTPLEEAGCRVHIIGGADGVEDLSAETAIRAGALLATQI